VILRKIVLKTNKISTNIFIICLSAILGLLILQYNISVVLGGMILLAALGLMIAFPELGTWAAFFAIYTNLPVIATKFHGMPQIVALAIPLFLCIPLASHLIVHRERLIVDHVFLLMLLFLVVLVSSSMFAKDTRIAADWIRTFLFEGLILYLLIINVIRHIATLRRVIWVLSLTCSLLGALSLYQELTHSYANQFGGLAQRDIAEETSDRPQQQETRPAPKTNSRWIGGAERASGPLDGPNRYAQILLVILPFALFHVWGGRSRGQRLGAAAAAIFIVSGVLLTYSRGACVTLALLLLILTWMRYIRPYQVLLSAAALVLIVAIAAPRYLIRLDTMRGVSGLVSNEAEVRPDGAMRGRLTEMLAALKAFLDYPILGVGPGQYFPFYSIEYQLDPDIAFRHLPTMRRAHILYFEMAADTGIIGFTVFMAMILLPLYRLWQARRRLLHWNPELANTATACILSLIAYLGTGLFLHFAYQRYYWVLLALVGAAVRICHTATPPQNEPPAMPLDAPSAQPQVALQSV
jgi:putative inorganic carbon (HCO3(-)) transporter